MAEELESASAEALLSFKNGAIKFESDQGHDPMHDIKMEPDDIKMEVEEEVLGPSVLGLKRVGEEMSPTPQPGLVLNRRGMPQRIRKKNRLFYDDDVVNAVLIKTKRNPISKTAQASKKALAKKPKEEPTKLDSPDRRLGQKVGMRLRNLLKLPKAHKWVCYEWFYSNIDKALFGGDNDFTICLKESFPQLKTHMLTRVEWCKMRRMMGKPRRCSQAFFEEERRELERKRAKIRLLQQRKGGDPTNCKDLPNEIPLQLVIGSKVTARLRKPQDGLFTGSIDAVDTSNNTYRITFERPGLGTHSVPDYEVLSNEPPDTISLSSFSSQYRTRHSGLLPSCTVSPYTPLTSDPLLSAAPPKPKSIVTDGTLGGFPIRVLEKVVRLNKILNIKRIRINRLRELNTEAERKKSFGEPISEDFQKRYANKVIELEHLNTHLREILAQVQQHCQELAPQASVAAMLTPSHIRDQSLADARELVNKHNTVIKDQKILDLVTDLTSLMLQVKSLSDSERSSYEVEILNTSMEQIKMKLSPVNQRVFENCVEVHMRHIQTGLGGHLGPLNTSFMAQKA